MGKLSAPGKGLAKLKRVQDFACPVGTTVAVLGGKWKAPILHHLLEHGTMRFGALRKALPGPTQQMLVNQLRELEQDGVVRREVFREVPPRVEYSATELGKTLRPVLDAMCEWGIGFEQRLVREEKARLTARSKR